jgi:hypothetical protein
MPHLASAFLNMVRHSFVLREVTAVEGAHDRRVSAGSVTLVMVEVANRRHPDSVRYKSERSFAEVLRNFD